MRLTYLPFRRSDYFEIFILIAMAFVTALGQGLMKPMVALLFESRGISASANGLNAAALYIGILVASPFMELLAVRVGFRRLMLAGLGSAVLLIVVFPFVIDYNTWLVLRFFLGVFEQMTFYSATVILTTLVTNQNRGRIMAFWGFAFGAGYAVGPLLTPLMYISLMVPFGFIAGLSLIGFLSGFLIKEPCFDSDSDPSKGTVLIRYKLLLGGAWFALLPAFGYGFLDAVVSGSLPVFLLRSHLNPTLISVLLTVFFSVGLITQLPLGILGDKIGRHRLLILLLAISFAGLLIPLVSPEIAALFVGYGIVGATLGSLYTLGVSFMADIVPRWLLPTSQMFCSVSFCLGCILGPIMAGTFIETLPGLNLVWLLILVFFLLFAGLVAGGRVPKKLAERA